MKKQLITLAMLLMATVTFAQYRVSTENGTFTIQDLSNANDFGVPYAKDKVFGFKSSATKVVVKIEGVTYNPKILLNPNGLEYTEFRDGNNADATFASAAAVDAWFKANTGFKTASGGSGAFADITGSPSDNTALSAELSKVVIVNAKTLGAVGDGVTDDSPAIQAIIDNNIPTNPQAGGIEITFPDGVYRLATPLIIKYRNITFLGTGNRNVQLGSAAGLVLEGGAVLAPDNGVNAIVINNLYDNNNFTTNKISIIGSGTTTASAVEFLITGNEFRRDFTFDKTTISGFENAFYFNKTSGTESAFGKLRVQNSLIMHNKWIHQQLTSVQWNGFSFTNNDAGQNGFAIGDGGIFVRGHNVVITDNILEGQRNAVEVNGGYEGLVIMGNYFEANVGDFCVNLKEVKSDASVHSNVFVAVTAKHRVLVDYAGRLNIQESFFPKNSYFNGISQNNTTNNAATDGFLAIDYPTYDIANEPDYKAVTYGLANDDRMINPLDGGVLMAEKMTTGGTGDDGSGRRTFTYGSLAGNVGDWVVFTFAFQQSEGSYDPYATIDITGTLTDHDYGPAYNFGGTYRFGDLTMVTYAKRIGETMTSAAISFYPFGTAPAAGLVAKYSFPTAYVVDNVNKIKHWLPKTSIRPLSAPTTGTWEKGDFLENRSATSNVMGWYCVNGGSPGTWVAVNPVNTINSTVTGEPTGSDVILNVVSLTQAEYDAGTPVATTYYVIVN